MRLRLGEVERIAPVPFVLIAGMLGGVLQALVEFIHNTTAGAFAGFMILAAAAIVLWWLSVRRRQHALWSAACQVTCVIGLAQLVSAALVIPHFLQAKVHLQSLDVSVNVLVPQLVLSPIRFLEALMLVALGRFLPGSGRGHASPPPPAIPEQVDAVT